MEEGVRRTVETGEQRHAKKGRAVAVKGRKRRERGEQSQRKTVPRPTEEDRRAGADKRQ